VVQVPLLVEQDFGSHEGKKYGDVSLHPKKGQQPQEQKGTPGFVAAESKESMAQRADAFLDDHLLPLFESCAQTTYHTVAIVSHGIMLSVLWKRLLRRLPPRNVKFAPEIVLNSRGPTLERLGAWSNTGYLELYMRKVALHGASSGVAPVLHPTSNSAPSEGVSGQATEEGANGGVRPAPGQLRTTSHEADNVATPGLSSGSPSPPTNVLRDWQTAIQTVNGTDHLKTLKRTRGGVGSSRFDPSQQSIDRVFKKRRIN
jgi:hypothetical protein